MKPGDYQPLPPEAHDYVDGRLSEEQEKAFERRLESDPQLAAQVQALRASVQMLHDLPEHEPPAGFDDRVLERIRNLDLAESARKRILPAPTPLWQNVVQVASGAVAAAVVFAIFGLPGIFGSEQPAGEPDSALAVTPMSAEPSEADLLPTLAEQFARFESLRRNVMHTEVADPDLQRQLLRLELELSGLGHGNEWLSSEVSRLPADQRLEYGAFLANLEGALEKLNHELTESRLDQRPVNLPQVRGALLGVQAPPVLTRAYRVQVQAALPADAVVPVSGSVSDEVRLYARVRHADYRHDADAMLKAAEDYLEHYGNGHLADHAAASSVAALLRLGRDRDAALRFNLYFSEWDSDLTDAQQAMLQGIFKEAENIRLQTALDALGG
jgi:anti-sigma-K factor RskA